MKHRKQTITQMSPSNMSEVRQEVRQAKTPLRGQVQHSFVLARHVHDHLLCLPQDQFVTVLAIEGVSYDLKSPEEQLFINEQFQMLLASLHYPVQILWRNLPLNLNDYLAHFTLPPPADTTEGDQEGTVHTTVQTRFMNAAEANTDTIWRLVSASHQEFLQRLGTQRTLLKRGIYLIIRVQGSAPIPQTPLQKILTGPKRRRQRQAQILEQARQELDLRANELMRQLTAMNLVAHRLRGPHELIPFYYSCLTPLKADRWPLSPAIIESLEGPIHAEGIAPTAPTTHPASTELSYQESSADAHATTDQATNQLETPSTSSTSSTSSLRPLDFGQLADLVAPAAMTLAPDYLTIEKEYARVLVIQNMPRTVAAGWLRPLAELDEPMEVSFHLQPRQSAGMIEQFRRQSRAYHSTSALAQGGKIEPDMHIAKTDVDELLMRLASGEERVLDVTLLITLRGQSKRLLEERTARIQSVLHSMLLIAREALFEQEKAFRSSLPHGRNEISGLLLDSRSASTLFPFLSNSLFHERGILEGITPQGDPVIMDAWAEGMANANRIILGPPGWGKSHSIKTTMIRQALKARAQQLRTAQGALPFQAIVIDPEREYSTITQQLNGQVIRLAPGSSQHLNPFDLPRQTKSDRTSSEHSDRLADHVQKMHTLLEIMLADRSPDGAGQLSSSEKGLLDRALYEAYRKVGVTTEPKTHDRPAPLMRDLYEVLKSGICGPDTSGLTQRLRRYVHGSLSGLFSGPTNVSLDHLIVDFDIHDLETELRPVGLFLVSNFVWVQSFQSRIPRQLIVDEAATLTQYESGALFLEDLVRRARKHYLGVTVISQHAFIFKESSIPANCATHVLMRQDATSVDLLEQMFKLTSREVQLLRHLAIGEALLITSDKRLHVRFEASEAEHLLATTDPREIAQWQEEHPQNASRDLLAQLYAQPEQLAEEQTQSERVPLSAPVRTMRTMRETEPLAERAQDFGEAGQYQQRIAMLTPTPEEE